MHRSVYIQSVLVVSCTQSKAVSQCLSNLYIGFCNHLAYFIIIMNLELWSSLIRISGFTWMCPTQNALYGIFCDMRRTRPATYPVHVGAHRHTGNEPLATLHVVILESAISDGRRVPSVTGLVRTRPRLLLVRTGGATVQTIAENTAWAHPIAWQRR